MADHIPTSMCTQNALAMLHHQTVQTWLMCSALKLMYGWLQNNICTQPAHTLALCSFQVTMYGWMWTDFVIFIGMQTLFLFLYCVASNHPYIKSLSRALWTLSHVKHNAILTPNNSLLPVCIFLAVFSWFCLTALHICEFTYFWCHVVRAFKWHLCMDQVIRENVRVPLAVLFFPSLTMTPL